MARPAQDRKILDEALMGALPVRARYLVGVSGGRDSIALLHSLVARGYRNLVVCHLDHQLRGRSSAADARFVAALAKKFGLGAEIRSVDVAKRASAGKQSIETAARAARYDFFADMARQHRCKKIFLAHHADDLVETFLMNLFRGAASEGLRSIRPVSIHKVGKTKLTVIRPLLTTWRGQIDDYIAAHRLKFREDATNRSLASTRNRFRHRIIPFLEKEFGREIRRTIWRTATIAADESAFLEDSFSPQTKTKLRVKDLQKLPVALQRRAIRSWLRDHAVANIGFDLIERVRALLDPIHGPAKVNLPNDWHARRRAGELFVV